VTKLIYSALTSLDGFIEDVDGAFSWAQPDEEVHAFVNELERSVGTYLYGRRMYETMVYWEQPPEPARQPPYIREYAAIWQAAEKIVYSRTLERASTERTRIEREFDPEAVRELKASEGSDVEVGGPELAAHAFKAGLVDECHIFLAPIAVGRGKSALPKDLRLELELLDERPFDSGMVHLHYRVRN
jgi:dihydrofolate reductase